MAKYDQGGGCACGLMKVCDCENNSQMDGTVARPKEVENIMGSPTEKLALQELARRNPIPTDQLEVGNTYQLIGSTSGYRVKPNIGGIWKIIWQDGPSATGVKDEWPNDHSGTPLRKDGLWVLIHAPLSSASRPGFDTWALGMAFSVSQRSRDPSTKVGAVIMRPDKSIASVGYNGFPRSMEDKPEWWNDRPQKYERVIHAEMNAILQAKESVQGCTIYITHPPCKDCAKHLAAAGIIRLVCYSSDEIRSRFNIDRSLELLTDCGIEIREIENVRNGNDATEGDQKPKMASRETGGKQCRSGNA